MRGGYDIACATCYHKPSYIKIMTKDGEEELTYCSTLCIEKDTPLMGNTALETLQWDIITLLYTWDALKSDCFFAPYYTAVYAMLREDNVIGDVTIRTVYTAVYQCRDVKRLQRVHTYVKSCPTHPTCVIL